MKACWNRGKTRPELRHAMSKRSNWPIARKKLFSRSVQSAYLAICLRNVPKLPVLPNPDKRWHIPELPSLLRWNRVDFAFQAANMRLERFSAVLCHPRGRSPRRQIEPSIIQQLIVTALANSGILHRTGQINDIRSTSTRIWFFNL